LFKVRIVIEECYKEGERLKEGEEFEKQLAKDYQD